ncbi:LydA family holin superfamily III, partial [Rhodobacter sp. JA431]
MNETRGLIEVADALFGGAITTAAAAFAGRLMWHSTEVRSGRRRFFGRELLWELPIAIGMAIIGEAVASYFG